MEDVEEGYYESFGEGEPKSLFSVFVWIEALSREGKKNQAFQP